MDRGAWQAAVHGVTKSQTRLSDYAHFSIKFLLLAPVSGALLTTCGLALPDSNRFLLKETFTIFNMPQFIFYQ